MILTYLKKQFCQFYLLNYSGIGFDGKTFKKIDINKINELDQSYDYVVAHAYHHCSKPHNGSSKCIEYLKKVF